MNKIKVIDTVRSFDRKQLTALRKFVASPYFNAGYNAEEVEELLDVLITNIKASVDKEALQAQFYPQKDYVDNKKNAIDNLLADLNGLVEEFIVYEELRPFLKGKSAWAKVNYFGRIQRGDRIWPIIKRYRKEWERRHPLDSPDWIERFEIEELAAAFRKTFKTQEGNSASDVTLTYLDKFYLAQKMRLGFHYYFQRRILGRTTAVDMQADPVWVFLCQNYDRLSDHTTPLSDLYYKASLVVEQPNDRQVLAGFESLLEQEEKNLPEEDRHSLYTAYRAMHSRQYQQSGAKDLIPFFLEMYKDHLGKGVLTVKGKLKASTLRLLVNIGIKAGDYKWVRQLLQDFTSKRIIHTRYPEESHRLCQAELLFAEKKYEEAESTIVYRLFEELNYSLGCDVLLIKIYFETQDDLLESRVRAMELKVRRAKLSAFDKKAYLNFISIIRKLDKYLWVKDERRIAKIMESIKSDKPLIEREWLMLTLESGMTN